MSKAKRWRKINFYNYAADSNVAIDIAQATPLLRICMWELAYLGYSITSVILVGPCAWSLVQTLYYTEFLHEEKINLPSGTPELLIASELPLHLLTDPFTYLHV